MVCATDAGLMGTGRANVANRPVAHYAGIWDFLQATGPGAKPAPRRDKDAGGGLKNQAPAPAEVAASSAATRRSGDIGTPKGEEAAVSGVESPKPQRTKRRRTDLPAGNTGEMEEMEMADSAGHTQ